MLQKILKALAAFSVLVLLYVRGSPISEYSLPKLSWIILFILALTFGISLVFPSEIAFYRRFAIAYLVLTGFAYLMAGILGLLPNAGLIEASAWDGLVSPYLLVSFLGQLIHRFPYTMARAPYETVPFAKHQLFSGTVVVVSAIATVAAFAMAKARRSAYDAWLALLGIFTVSWLGYLIVGAVSWGLKGTIFPLARLVSYAAAYVLARSGVALQPTGTRSIPANKVDIH